MARYMRSDLGRGHTNLRPPVVVNPAAPTPLAPPLSVTTIAHRSRASIQRVRRDPVYKLRGPIVVTPAATQIFFGPSITYWAAVKSRQLSRGQRRDVKSILRPPAVVGPGIAWHGPGLYSPGHRSH